MCQTGRGALCLQESLIIAQSILATKSEQTDDGIPLLNDTRLHDLNVPRYHKLGLRRNAQTYSSSGRIQKRGTPNLGRKGPKLFRTHRPDKHRDFLALHLRFMA